MLIHPANSSPELVQLMARFPGVRLANPDDGSSLADFFNSTAMSAGYLQIGFTRGDDYFSLLRLQGEKFAALVCEENGQIVGVGALTIRNSFARGRPTPVGYLQDLRVSPAASHRARNQFYQCFAECVRVSPQLRDFNHCGLFITAILSENIAAKNALSRSAFPLEYTRLSNYTAHVWPKTLPTATLGRSLLNRFDQQSNASNAIIDFYGNQLGRYAYDLSIDDIHRLEAHATPVVLHHEDKIIGACYLVQTDDERKLSIKQTQLKLSLNTSGTYITALRVAGDLPMEHKAKATRSLFLKALACSMGMPGMFTGYIATENSPNRVPRALALLSYRIEGSLYRVYHPEHSSLPEFSSGFLRPAHIPAFEWALS